MPRGATAAFGFGASLHHGRWRVVAPAACAPMLRPAQAHIVNADPVR